MTCTVEIGLLGPVLVRVDGAEVRVASTPQRVLLARLALADGRQCAPATLVDTLWYGEPPANAAENLHAYVSRLRQVIGTHRISREPGGRHRLRARRRHPADGGYLAGVDVPRLRLPRAVRRHRPGEGGRGRQPGERVVPGRRRDTVRRRSVRRGVLLRFAARPGRPGGPARRLELLRAAGFRDAALVVDDGHNLVITAVK